MSQTDAERDDLSENLYRSTSRLYTGHSDAEMNAIGWIVSIGAVLLLVPLLPFLVLMVIISKLLESAGAGPAEA